MKYLLPLFLISFCGFAAEPPVVKSKAAKELLKHPEFEKALEAAPELGKLLSALDKDAFMGARALKPLGKQIDRVPEQAPVFGTEGLWRAGQDSRRLAGLHRHEYH